MASQAGPVEELINYKKTVLSDPRRDSVIRGSIATTIDFFSTRRSQFIKSFDTIRDPKNTPIAKPAAMVYPQISRPLEVSSSYTNVQWESNEKGRLGDLEDGSVDSIHDAKHQHQHPPTPEHLTLRERLKHFTFAWYAFTMSTGGVAFTMSVLPNRFAGLTGLGTAIFVANLFLFTGVTITITARFIMHPGTFTHAFTNPHEGFFFATFWLSLATMITNTTAYGIPNSGPWLITALRIAFWIYTALVTLVAIFYYHVLFTVKKLVSKF